MIIRIGVTKKSLKGLDSINVNIYTIDVKEDFTDEEIQKISTSLINTVTEDHYTFVYNESLRNFQYFDTKKPYDLIQRFSSVCSLEVALLPGVTDNVGNTAKNIISELLAYTFDCDEGVYSSQVVFSKKEIPSHESISQRFNPLIQYCKLSHKNESNNKIFDVSFFGNDNILKLNDLYSEPNASIFIIPYVKHEDLEKKNI